jgi:hypothetical protein
MAHQTTTIALSTGMIAAGVFSVAVLVLFSWWMLAWLGVLPRRRSDASRPG